MSARIEALHSVRECLSALRLARQQVKVATTSQKRDQATANLVHAENAMFEALQTLDQNGGIAELIYLVRQAEAASQ